MQSIAIALLLLGAGFGLLASAQAPVLPPHEENDYPDDDDIYELELDSTIKGTVLLNDEPVEGALVLVISEMFYYPMEEPCYYPMENGQETFCGVEGGPFFHEFEDDWDEDDLEDNWFEFEFEDDWDENDFADYWYDEDFEDDWYDEDWFEYPDIYFPEPFIEYVLSDENGHFEMEVHGDQEYQILVAYSEDLDLEALIAEYLEPEVPEEEPPCINCSFDDPYLKELMGKEFPDFEEDLFEYDDIDMYYPLEDDLDEMGYLPGMEDLIILPGTDWEQVEIYLAYRDLYVDNDVSVEFTMELEEVYTVLLPPEEEPDDEDPEEPKDEEEPEEPEDPNTNDTLRTQANFAGQSGAGLSNSGLLTPALALGLLGLFGLFLLVRRR